METAGDRHLEAVHSGSSHHPFQLCRHSTTCRGLWTTSLLVRKQKYTYYTLLFKGSCPSRDLLSQPQCLYIIHSVYQNCRQKKNYENLTFLQPPQMYWMESPKLYVFNYSEWTPYIHLKTVELEGCWKTQGSNKVYYNDITFSTGYTMCKVTLCTFFHWTIIAILGQLQGK